MLLCVIDVVAGLVCRKMLTSRIAIPAKLRLLAALHFGLENGFLNRRSPVRLRLGALPHNDLHAWVRLATIFGATFYAFSYGCPVASLSGAHAHGRCLHSPQRGESNANCVLSTGNPFVQSMLSNRAASSPAEICASRRALPFPIVILLPVLRVVVRPSPSPTS